MSSIVITGDTSGSVTLAAPALAGTTTLTLPNTSGTVALASQLGGMTLLGAITTISGTSATLSGLTLTSYRQLYLVFNSVGMISASGGGHVITIGALAIGNAFASGVQQTYNGACTIDLSSGYASTLITNPNTSGTLASFVGKTSVTTASTSITVTTNNVTATFNANSISVYGVK